MHEQLKLDNQLCFPLYATAREVVKHYKPYLDELGLTYTQYIVLMVLWEQDGVQVKELGRRLHLDSGTLTPLCKKMEAAGLVTRRRNPADERNVIVELTDAGRALEKPASKVPTAMASCLPLEPDEAQQLYTLLYKVLGGIAEDAAGA